MGRSSSLPKSLIVKTLAMVSLIGKWMQLTIGVNYPIGRIKQLIGRSLTWKDEPVEKKIKGLEICV